MRVYLNLLELLDYTGDNATISFVDLSHIYQLNEDYLEDLSQIEIKYANGTHYVTGFDVNGTQLWQKTNLDVLDISLNLTYIEFDGTLSNKAGIKLFTEAGVVSFPNQLLLYVYRQKSENDVLSKDLVFVNIIVGKLNHAIGFKNINVDITNYDRDFNYIEIPSLNRFYYVDSIELISADVVRYHLKEDVLMSWKALIRSQKAFVTRYENSSETNIVDVRLPLEDVLSVEYITPTMTQSGLVNTTLSANLSTTVRKFLVSTISHDIAIKHDVSAPTGTTLPSFTSLQSQNERNAFIDFNQLHYLIDAVLDNDNIMTFINSVILLPFDPFYPYKDASTDGYINYVVLAEDKYLCDDGKFHALGSIPSGVNMVGCSGTTADASPYFIVADFTFNGSYNNFLDYDPYTTWEIYIAFAGWIKVNASQVLNKRIIIYYTLDYKTGMGTAYIYNVTDNKLIWSSNCQFGVKMDLTTTNSTEITRQKQANELNMILGLMASALSIGVGVATENPVAVAGGILSAGKTIASNVNNNNMLFERAQTSFGTSEGVFHSPFSIVIRRTYHKKVNINSATYKHIQGLPYNQYTTTLSSLSGYVEIGEIHFDPKNYVIYQDEINEIVELLQKGVIF